MSTRRRSGRRKSLQRSFDDNEYTSDFQPTVPPKPKQRQINRDVLKLIETANAHAKLAAELSKQAKDLLEQRESYDAQYAAIPAAAAAALAYKYRNEIGKALSESGYFKK